MSASRRTRSHGGHQPKWKQPEFQTPKEPNNLLVPESKMISQLLNADKKLNATIARKHVELQEIFRASRIPKIIRLYIFNEYAHQDTPDGDEPACWTLKIQGHILEPETLLPTRGAQHCFSNYVSKVVVQLDPKVYPGTEGTIEWRKATTPSLSDGFELKRRGHRKTTARIQLYLEHCPARFKVATPALAALLGLEGSCETKRAILLSLFNYVRANKLQSPTDPTMIVLNADLRQLFNNDEALSMSQLASRVRAHLLPPDPLEFKYTIMVTGEPMSNADVYDVHVESPHPFAAPAPQVAQPVSAASGLSSAPPPPPAPSAADVAALSSSASQLQQHLRRRELLLTFADAPVQTMRAAIAQQAKEAESKGSGLSERHSDFYHQDWIPDAIDRYLVPPEAAPPPQQQQQPAAPTAQPRQQLSQPLSVAQQQHAQPRTVGAGAGSGSGAPGEQQGAPAPIYLARTMLQPHELLKMQQMIATQHLQRQPQHLQRQPQQGPSASGSTGFG